MSPAFVGQMLYIHVFLTFGTALLFSVLAACADLKTDRLFSIPISAVCIAISLGLYQSYIGVTLFILIVGYLSLILDSGSFNLRYFLKRILKSIAGLGGGLCLYWICMKLQIKLYKTKLATYSGADTISVKSVISNMPSGIVRQYSNFLKYFGTKNDRYHLLWIMFLILVLITLAIIIARLAKQKEYAKIISVVIALILIPPMANLINIIAPGHEITLIMSFQMQLIIPFALSLVSKLRSFAMNLTQDTAISPIQMYSGKLVTK